MEIYLYYAIFSLDLPIALRVKSRKKLLFNVKEVVEWGPKHSCKKRALVTDYWFQEVILSHYHLNNHFYEFGNIGCKLNWHIVDYFYKIINSNKN